MLSSQYKNYPKFSLDVKEVTLLFRSSKNSFPFTNLTLSGPSTEEKGA